MQSRLFPCLALLLPALGASGQSPPATNMTAFALVKEGDKFIATQARDKITQIYSEKSGPSLAPDVWYVDYFDATTAFKETEVKFVAGKKTEIKQPKHLFDAFSGSKRLDWKKLKIDSNGALAIALKEPALKNRNLQAVQFWLEREATICVWKIRFWAAKPDKPDKVDEIGDIYISSKSGEVLKNKLH